MADYVLVAMTDSNALNVPPNHEANAEHTCCVTEATTQGEADDANVGSRDDDDHHHHPIQVMKKPRFIWDTERHQLFVKAVEKLGDKAVPKKILEVMNIPELTRDQVASHLQKYRIHLLKKSNETQQRKPNVQASYGSGTRAVAPPKYDTNNMVAANNNNNNFPCYQHMMPLHNASSSSGNVGWDDPSWQRLLQNIQRDDERMSVVTTQQPYPIYLMASPSQSQTSHEAFQVGTSQVNQNTMLPQLNNTSSSLNNSAELFGYNAPPVLASHPTSSSGIHHQQQQQLHNSFVRPFHPGPLCGFGSSNIDSSFLHQGGN